jgi:hypothetical protein
MPDEKDNTAAPEGQDGQNGAGENSQDGADKKPEGDNGAGGDNDAGAGEGGDNKAGDGTDKDNAKAPEEGKPKEGDNKDIEDDGKAPPTKPRMSSKDFIIQRQQKKIAKMKAAENQDDQGEEEDEEIDPDDKKKITKVVAEQFAPIIDRTQAAEDEREISDFLTKNPDFKPFEKKVRRFITDESRRHLPVESIFYEVAGPHLLKMGAERKIKADEAAKHTTTGGGSSRGAIGEKSISAMTKDEFEAEQEKVRRGGQ